MFSKDSYGTECDRMKYSESYLYSYYSNGLHSDAVCLRAEKRTMSTFERALALHETGDVAAAVRDYRNVVASGSTAAPQQIAAAYSNLGMILGGKKRHQECLHYSMSASKVAPSNALVLYNLANAQLELHRDEEADSTYRRVLRIHEDHAPSYHNLALLAHRRGSAEDAHRLFKLALACGPKELEAIGGEAQVYASMAAAGLSSSSDAAKALAAQRAAVAASPRSAQSQVRLAERLLDAAAVKGDGHGGGHPSGGTGDGVAHESEAERALLAAIALAPADAHALNLLGTVLQARPGRWQEAESMYAAALQAEPAHADAYHNLGTVKQRLGRLDEARAMYSHALRLAPRVSNVYISLASLARQEESVALLSHAIRLKPQDADGYARLAAALAPRPLGGATSTPAAKLRKAISAMAHAARLRPQSPHPRAELGRLRVALSTALLAEGVDDLREAARLQPPTESSTAAAHNAASVALASLGRSGEAAGWYREAMELSQRAARAAHDAVAAPAGQPALARGVEWRRAARSLCSNGYWILDDALGRGVAASLRNDTVTRLLPLMQRGRVGTGLESDEVRTDWLWRHRRGEAAVVNSAAAHMEALHALFDALPIGLNELSVRGVREEEEEATTTATEGEKKSCEARRGEDGGAATAGYGGATDPANAACASSEARSPSRSCERAWSLVHAEDLQFACYRPGGYYRRHSDAQNASRRVLTAIYYLNEGWEPADGGMLRLYAPSSGVESLDIEPLADRLVVFDSRIEHEVMTLSQETATAKRKSKKKAKHAAAKLPAPRCAATQWLQDFAPPLMRSGLADQTRAQCDRT